MDFNYTFAFKMFARSEMIGLLILHTNFLGDQTTHPSSFIAQSVHRILQRDHQLYLMVRNSPILIFISNLMYFAKTNMHKFTKGSVERIIYCED